MRKNLVFLVIALIAAPSMMAAVQPQIIIVNNLPGPGFAPFSVVNSQTARINAVMGAEPHLNQPCEGVIQLRFFDSTGNVLAQRTARFSPTAVESLEFMPAREAIGRMQIRADISWVNRPPGTCRGDVIGNVEVYSNVTGQTQFVLPGMIQGFQEVDNGK